jgi:hypothetical protein
MKSGKYGATPKLLLLFDHHVGLARTLARALATFRDNGVVGSKRLKCETCRTTRLPVVAMRPFG